MDKNIKELLSLINEDKNLVSLFNRGRDLNVTGLCDEQKGFVAASLCAQKNKKPVIISPDAPRARVLQDQLQAFVDGEVLTVFPDELNLVSAVSASSEGKVIRAGVLSKIISGQYGAIIIVGGALLNKLPAKKEFKKRVLNIKLGDTIDPSELAEILISAGYKRTAQVNARGEFSGRGDVMDIFPPDTEDPIRLSFFDDEVDQIKVFDMEDQRSTDSLKKIVINPSTEIFISENRREQIADKIVHQAETEISQMVHTRNTAKVSELLKRTATEDAEKVRTGRSLVSYAKWLNIILPEYSSILDYVDDEQNVLFVDELTDIVARMKAYGAEYTIRCQESFEIGIAPKSAVSALLDFNDVMKNLDEISGKISMSVLGTSGFARTDKVQVTGMPTPTFRGREKELADSIKEDQRRLSQKLFIIIPEGKRVDSFRERMKEYECFPKPMVGNLARGFTYPQLGITVLGQQDIFGSDKITAPKKKGKNRLTFFGDINAGDYVVHDSHGIGRYEGLVNMKVGESSKDYMKIVYAKDEVLYILPEDIDTLQKYVGPGGREPKLSSLGGDQWKKSVSRARQSVKEVAFDLLKLYAARSKNKGFQALPDDDNQRKFEESFPYVETEDQLRAIKEIKQDMESEKPMDRLLCGDVGFGKTEVAFRALVKCVLSGRQAFMLAPTTLLAQQHYDNFKERLGDIPFNVVLLSRFTTPSQMKKNLEDIKTGKADVIIGTHRVLSKDVVPKNLGLLVVDEEQRFGVNHKEQIKAMKSNIDVLTLSATPIPRTLHMSMSGIRDISVLDEAPINRRPVQIYVMGYDEDIIVQACMREISRGGQIFYLYNRTSDIDKVTKKLQDLMPGARIIFAHGRMAEHQMEQIFNDFSAGEYDILVCTTIIENGVDMPNVNTMIVEDSDRFGLSQLYQIKGRVGRSDKQAYAYVTYDEEKILNEDARKRLEALREFTELGSGVKIAIRDLEVRGAGNLLGAEQHGQMDVIGYELYCRMLEEEIKELQDGNDPAIEAEESKSQVEVDFDSYIPSSFIEDQTTRMVLYRRIGSIKNKQDYDDFFDEITDRYGDPPKQIYILADAAFIRNMSAQVGFEKVSIKATGVKFYFYPNKQIDMKAMSALMQEKDLAGRIRINATGELYMAYKPSSMQHDKTMNEIVRILCVLLDNKSVA